MANEYIIQKETLDNIANPLRILGETTGTKTPAQMATIATNANTTIATQGTLLDEVIEALEGKTFPAPSLENKTLTLGASAPSTVTPSAGYDGLSSVSVVLDTNVIKAENIAKDVTMLGITGAHEGGGKMDEDIEFAQFMSTEPIVANYPEVSSLRSYALYGSPVLTIASFPACSTIGSSAFYNCGSLTITSFPACTTIGDNAFGYCQHLTIASFPACTTIGSSAFSYCSQLTTANFPACTTINDNAFQNCGSLTTANFPACTAIGNSAFYSCCNLRSLYLTGSQYVTLSAGNAFTSTPIGEYTTSTGGVYGNIYVPVSMLESYKTRTNWSFFSSRFVGV